MNLKIYAVAISAVLSVAATLASCESSAARTEEGFIDKARVFMEARAAAEAILTSQAEQRGSRETFSFVSAVEEEGVIVMIYQGHHPDWFLYTHSTVTVTFAPSTGTIRQVKRHDRT